MCTYVCHAVSKFSHLDTIKDYVMFCYVMLWYVSLHTSIRVHVCACITMYAYRTLYLCMHGSIIRSCMYVSNVICKFLSLRGQKLLIQYGIQAMSIAPLHVHYYSEALPTQHGYCVGVSRRSATGNCE